MTMRTFSRLFVAALLSGSASYVGAQAPAANQAAAAAPLVTANEEQINKLEAELSKLRDTSPEAADVMLKLADLYHADGRVFGLIRVGQTFVNTFTSHPQHKVMMQKLLDGLVATSRNKETVTLCRQFLQRYPDDAAAARFELTLAQTLLQLEDRLRAAETYDALWQRLGDTPDGRKAAVSALTLYNALGNRDSWTKAATLADSVFDKAKAGDFATRFGLEAVTGWQRVSDWGKSNAAGQKLLKKNLPADAAAKAYLYFQLATNDAGLGQRANAAENLKKARAVKDSRDLLSRQIFETSAAAGTPQQLEPLIAEYVKKYPWHPDLFSVKSQLPAAYLRAKNKDKAVALLKELLLESGPVYSVATTFVVENAADPAKHAETEQVLKQAIEKNPKQAGALRAALALHLYRDRMKDLDKARATVRELIAQSPTNDGASNDPVYWLLYNPEDDAAFKKDVQAYLKSREQHAELGTYRGLLTSWINQARNNKTLKERIQLVRDALDKADESPIVQAFAAAESAQTKNQIEARGKLLEDGLYRKLTENQARAALVRQAEALRIGSVDGRKVAVELYGKAAKRFPTEYPLALGYFETAGDFAPPEVAKEAALALLKLEAPSNNSDTWRRLMSVADKNADPKLAQAAWDWIKKTQAKYGDDVGNASYIGDMLDKYGLKDEALAVWKKCWETNPDSLEARYCVERLVNRAATPAERTKLLRDAIAKKVDYHGQYSAWLAGDLLKAGDVDGFEKALRDSRAVQDDRPGRVWGVDDNTLQSFVDTLRADKEADAAKKKRVFEVVRDMGIGHSQATARLGLLELAAPESMKPMDRLLAYQAVSTLVGNDSSEWDQLYPYAQAAMTRKDYPAAATLVTGMLANVTGADAKRKQSGRDVVGQSYARMGAAGLSIDETSPIAPLLQAALYLRLGDERLAFDSYVANQKLFDEHRNEMPVDLILFVCENHIAAGGDANHDRAEDILRTWLVKYSEAKDVDDATKAGVQLLLAKNFFKSQRFDVARSEFQTVVNRWGSTPQAVEAEFGIGESYMAQKVYDQAEQVFEKLINSRDRDVVIRAEFLKGVLANRRGDREEARDIFKAVLERVPSIELANQALFNLSEVYGAEQRYMDQLELLRTVGRLGRTSERWHAPGTALAIVVQDSDLGISRGHARIPVRVTTEPGGDEEVIYLYSGGAGKGLFRADLETRLGSVTKGDKVLQLTGKDVIKCDYPEEFKAEFKSVPLSDADIRIAADAKFEVSSAKIIDEKEETFSEKLEREAREKAAGDNAARAAERPTNQVKPGNIVYVRVQDADRDQGDQPDEVTVKLVATSGDQVQVKLVETAPHSGVFEGTATTGDLPAGAVASDTSIDHSPLMAIDRDPKTFWLSEPDGAAPKSISVDMKDLKTFDRVTVQSPNAEQQIPVRGDLEASNDGRFWFRLASQPPQAAAEKVADEYGVFTRSVYEGNHTTLTTWEQIVSLAKNQKPIEQGPVNEVLFNLNAEQDDAGKTVYRSHAAIWHGKVVQPKTGAARITLTGTRTALAIDGLLELAPGEGNRYADVWLEQGTHDVTIFIALASNSTTPASATIARENHSTTTLELLPFTAADFDLKRAEAQAAVLRPAPTLEMKPGLWEAKFAPVQARHVRFNIKEFLGEAVAINQIEVEDTKAAVKHVPTEADVLSLATNDVLEIAAGDKVTATYSDDLTQVGAGRSQLLTASLQATYYNGQTTSIAYDFKRNANGAVSEIRKELVRVDPGQRLIIEVTDFDMDVTPGMDKIKLEVCVNNGEPLVLEAHEQEQRPGIFTKEVDTSAEKEEGKLQIKPGDEVICRYLDEQNTFPGHSVPRESVVYVAQPSQAQIRVVETRFAKPPRSAPNALPQILYLPASPSAEKTTANVAFEAPLTVEVIDPDMARDNLSRTTVELQTTSGAKIEVECVIASDISRGTVAGGFRGGNLRRTIEEGRFVGQVIMQLGGKDSPDIVPLVAGMPRNLLGGGKLPEADAGNGEEEVVVTRVLNVSGNDMITAKYLDKAKPADAPADVSAQGRLIANATLASLDRDYEHEVTQLHVGEKMFFRIVDADLDTTDERDRAKVSITTERGDKEEIELEETLAHSGIFTGSVLLKPNDKPTPGNSAANEPTIEAYFGDKVMVQYVDKAAGTETGELALSLELPVVVGTDGLVAAFSKTFGDETLAVETQFHIAESYFELFKSHQKLERKGEQETDLEAGRRVLREVMEDYPNPKYVARIAYLLGQFAQELKDYDEAIDNYQLIVKQYPDSTLAADAQYKLAQCYEERGDFEQALEAYVTLAATYPKSGLIANVMIRISEYFYKAENFVVAAQVGEKFLERFEGHEWGPRMAFRIGQCYYKGKDYTKAGESFDKFTKIFPDDALCADAWFWSGESWRMGGDSKEAFRRYNWCRWKFAESEAAKYARGRLALPEMLNQFQSEANSIDNQN
jgi:TolA-binding protein/SOS-response transcriptional repressor LexA